MNSSEVYEYSGHLKFLSEIVLKSGPCRIHALLVIHWSLVVPYMVTWNFVDIGSGNCLLPDGTKPIPEPVLTYVISEGLLYSLSYSPEDNFTGNAQSRYQSLDYICCKIIPSNYCLPKRLRAIAWINDHPDHCEWHWHLPVQGWF